MNRLREKTKVRVPKSYLFETDPAVLGEPAMIVERIIGCTEPTLLFKNPTRASDAESIARQLCEQLAALHTTDVALVNQDGFLNDP